MLDLTALDAGEYFTYIDTVEIDLKFGYPSIALWYDYRSLNAIH